MNFEIIRVEKLKTLGSVKRSALHTFREIDCDNAISEKFDENKFVGAKDAEGVYQAVKTRIEELDKKDKQAVRCVEFFISASPEQFAPNGKFHDLAAQDRYFSDALKWVKDKHGAENVVCHAIHRDEKTPHMIVYAVPVTKREAHTRKRSVGVKGGGRTLIEVPVPAQSELGCKAYYGDPKSFQKLQDDFHAGVGKPHGLDRGISRAEALKHKSPARWYAEQQALLDALALDISRREKEIEALRAKLAEELDTEKMCNAELRQYRNEAAAKLVKLDQELEAVKDQAAEVAKERDVLSRVGPKLERWQKDLEQREAAVVGLEDRQTKLDALAKLLEEKKTVHNDAVEKLKVDFVDYHVKMDALVKFQADFRAVTQGHTPDQIAGALTVIAATKKKGIDMDHLTQGDCVIILGKTWADKKGIRTAEDMMKPADPDDAAWARRVGLPKPKPDNQVQGVKR